MSGMYLGFAFSLILYQCDALKHHIGKNNILILCRGPSLPFLFPKEMSAMGVGLVGRCGPKMQMNYGPVVRVECLEQCCGGSLSMIPHDISIPYSLYSIIVWSVDGAIGERYLLRHLIYGLAFTVACGAFGRLVSMYRYGIPPERQEFLGYLSIEVIVPIVMVCCQVAEDRARRAEKVA